MGETKPAANHLDLLDGLRALAILFVVFFHLWEISWFAHRFTLFGVSIDLNFIPVTGYLGVDIFFFISGFCIFYPLVRSAAMGLPREGIFPFYMKRVFKIVPSYLLCIGVILAFFDRETFRSASFAVKDLGTHLLFIHNWFHDTSRSINGVLWSLGVEVQFYLLFPWISRAFTRKPLATYFTLTGTALLYRGLLVAFHQIEDHHWLYLLPGYLDLFSQGMLAAHLTARLKTGDAPLRRWLSLAGALLCFGLLLTFTQVGYVHRYDPNGNHIFQSFYRFPIGLTLLGFTLCGQSTFPLFQTVFANRLMKFFSKISYNWYLWHQFIARTMRGWKVIPSSTADPHHDPVWMARFHWTALLVTIAICAFLTYFFELPLLERGKRWLREREARGKRS